MSMKYYVDAIEQTKGTEEGTYNEYGSRTRFGTYDESLNKMYTMLGNATKGNHVFMDVKITNSEGGIVKKDQYGKYIDTDLEPAGE